MRSHLIAQMWRGANPWGARKGKGRRRRVASMAAVLALGPAAVLAAVIGAAPSASATTVPSPPSGWTTAFSDSFSGAAGSGVDSNWTDDIGTQYSGTGCTGNWGTGEVETETSSPANVSEDGSGHLNITALDSGGSWTSGRIETVADNFAAPAGGEMEVSASIKQPNPANGLGYWPAFWMLGAGFRASGAGTSGSMDCSNWPSVGEVDIMEDVNALSEHSGTFHCGVDPGGPCNETTGISSGLQACSGCQTGYNTYSVIVNRTNTSAESITWYLNGTAYYTVSESQVPTATWQAAVDHGFFLILDVAIGGQYPNNVCGCTSPGASTSSGGAMGVGYVAVYTTSGSGSSGNTVTVANPGSQTSTVGTAARLQMSGSDSASGQTLTYSATGLPAGLSINSSTGLISGTPTTAGSSTVTVTAKDTTGATGSVSFSWTVNASGGGGGSGGGTSCTTTATSDISADCYSASHGTIDVTSATGDSNPSGVDGNQVAQLVNGDYLEYANVNFGTAGSTQFDARVASGAAGGVSGLVEVVLDSPSNAPVGSFAVGNTGGWSSWETVPANITKVTGTHNVYLELVSGAGGNPPYVSLHYFNFPAT
jgi:Carbohydrate binding module (family 6)/Putative Ig domain/Glycosyl hydrolases family 16